MANDRNLKVNLSVTADIKEAQQKMKTLMDSLGDLKIKPQISIDDKVTKDLTNTVTKLEGALSSAFNFDTGKLDLSKFSLELKNADLDIKTISTDLRTAGEEGRKAFLQLSQQIMMAETPTLTLNKHLKEFAGTLANTARWQLSSSFLHGAIGAIQSAIGYAKELDDSLNKIQIVTGKSDAEMAKFAESANKAAQALSTTTNRYAEASLIYFQQGLSAKEVEERAAITVKMANVTGDTAETVSQQLTSVWNNFADGSKSLEYFADGMTALGAATATSSAEIAQGLQKFSSIGETVGLSYEYAASALATITATTRESADTVGNALKSLFARIEGLNLGETAEDGTTLNKYSAALAKVGVNIKDANGKLKDMDQILDELGERWQTLGREQQVALAQTVAGQRQYAQLMTLMNNWDFMKENLKTVESSSGTLQKQADIYAQSWEAASARVRASLEEVYAKLADADFFVDMSNVASGLINIISDVIDGLGGVPGILLLISSIFMKNFAKEIPSTLTNIKNTFALMSQEAKKSATSVQDSVLEELEKLRSTQVGKKYDFEIEKIQILGKLKQDYNDKVDHLTNAEKLQYENLISNVDKSLGELQKLKKIQDELIAQQNKARMNTGLSSTAGQQTMTITKIDGTQEEQTLKKIRDDYMKTADTVAEQMAKIQQAKKVWEEGFSKVGVKDDFNQLTAQATELFRKLLDGGSITQDTFDKFKTAIKSANGDTEIFISSISDLFMEIEEGDSESSKFLDNLVQNLKNGSPEAKALAQALEDYKRAVIASKQGTEEYNNSLEALKSNTREVIQHQREVSEVIGDVVSNASKAASGYMSMSRSIETLGNTDIPVFDKFVTLTTSLPMMISGFNGLTSMLGVFGSAAGPIGLAITALSAIPKIISTINEADQKKLEEMAENYKKIADNADEAYKSLEQEQKSNQSLIDEYKRLLENYNDTHEGKAELIETGKKLVDTLGDESDAILLLRGEYDSLADSIDSVNIKQLEELAQKASAAANAAQTSIYASALTESGFKQSKSSNIGYLNQGEDIALLIDMIDLADMAMIHWDKDAEVLSSNFEDLSGPLQDAFLNFQDMFGTIPEDTKKILQEVKKEVDEWAEETGQSAEEYGTLYATKFQEALKNKIQEQDVTLEETQFKLEIPDDNKYFEDKLKEAFGEEFVIDHVFTLDLSQDTEEAASQILEINDVITKAQEEILANLNNEEFISKNFGGNKTSASDFVSNFLGGIFSEEFQTQLKEAAEKTDLVIQQVANLEVHKKIQELNKNEDFKIESFNDYKEVLKQITDNVIKNSNATEEEREEVESIVDDLMSSSGLIKEEFSDQFKIIKNTADALGMEAEEVEKIIKGLGLSDESIKTIDLKWGIKLINENPNSAKSVKDAINKVTETEQELSELQEEIDNVDSVIESLEGIVTKKSISQKDYGVLENLISWEDTEYKTFQNFLDTSTKNQKEFLSNYLNTLKNSSKENNGKISEISDNFNTYGEIAQALRLAANKTDDNELAKFFLDQANIFNEKQAEVEDAGAKAEAEKKKLEAIFNSLAEQFLTDLDLSKIEKGTTFSDTEYSYLIEMGVEIPEESITKLQNGSVVITDNISKIKNAIINARNEKLDLDLEDFTSLSEVLKAGKDLETFIKLKDATGELTVSLEDLGSPTIREALSQTLSPEEYKKYAEAIDLSSLSIGELKGWYEVGAISAERYASATKDVETTSEQLATILSKDNLNTEDLSQLFSFANDENISLEDRTAVWEEIVKILAEAGEVGKITGKELEDLYDTTQKLLEADDNLNTTKENFSQLQAALENGEIDLERFRESVDKLLSSEHDWSMTDEEVITTLLNLEIAINKANGTLESNAKAIGENCETMEDYQALLVAIKQQQVDEATAEKMTSAALIKVSEGYEDSAEALSKYEAALRSGNKQQQEAAKSALEYANRISEICKSTGKERTEIEDLANSFKDLYVILDENNEEVRISDEVAADLAERYININEGIKNLQENYESYEEVLTALTQAMDPTNPMTYNDVIVDQAENLKGLREAMAQVLNMTDASVISNQFLAENADLVSQAINGESTAIEELQIRMAEKLMLEVGIDDEEFQKIAESVGMTCNNIREWLTSLPEGQLSLDNIQFVQGLVDAMQASKWSREQIENALSGIGLDIDLEPYNKDLQDAVDNMDTAQAEIVKIAEKGAQAVADATATDTEVEAKTQDYTEKHEGIDWEQVPNPITVDGTYVRPLYRNDPQNGSVLYGFDTLKYSQTYAGISVRPIPKSMDATNQVTGTALRVKSGSYSRGGNISFKNSSGGNKPAQRTTSSSSSSPRSYSSPRSSSSGSSTTSAPRTTVVSGNLPSPIEEKIPDEISTDKFSMEDYRQKKIQRDIPNYEEYDEDVYTNRIKYRNERYDKHEKFTPEDYVTKDSSIFLVMSDEIDLYYEETRALEKLSSQLQEIETRKSRAFGQAHLDAIAEERANIEQTIEAQQTYLDKLSARGEELQRSLMAQGFNFDENGLMTNYDELMPEKLKETNIKLENVYDERNEIIKRANIAGEQNVQQRNETLDAIKDWKNAILSEGADTYNEAQASIDSVVNRKSKIGVNNYNKALDQIADTEYDEKTLATKTYEDIVNEAGTNKDVLVKNIKDELSNLVKQEDEYRRMRIESATDEYQKILNMYSGTYTDSDMADLAKQEISEAEKIYNNTVKTVNSEYDTFEKKATKDAESRIKTLEENFKETEKRAKNILDNTTSDSDYQQQVSMQKAKSEWAEYQRNLSNWAKQQRREAEETWDDLQYYTDNAAKDSEEAEQERFERRQEEIEKIEQQEKDLNTLREESIREGWQDLKDQIDELDEVNRIYDETSQQVQENKNRLYDLNLEEIDYTLELKVRLSDEVVKALDSLLDSLGDFADKAADKIAILGSKMYQFAVQTNATRDAVRDLLNSTNLVDDAVVARFMTGSYTEDDLQALFNVDQFTSDKVAQLEGYRDQLISLISEQRNLKNEMFDTVMTAFNEYQEKLDLQIEKISTLTKFTETYRNIIGIIGKKVLDASGELSEKLARNAFDTQRSQTKVYKTILDELDSNIADMKYKQRNYDLDSEMYRDFQERIDEMEAKRRQAQENWLSSWQAEMQAAADYYADAIDTITMVLDRSVSGLMDSLELLRQEYDRQKQISEVYVEDYEKIYQLNKLNRQVEAAIDDSEHIKNKQRLKKLQEEINIANQDGVKLSQYDLDVLQKKFELEMARSELEEATNAKSQVRMMRDAEGNYGFVYTADANAVADAEQNYEDKLHELQVLNTDYIKQLEENYLQLQQNVRDQLANLDITQFATEEEYLAEVNRIQQAALELQDRYGQQMTNATNNNQDLYNNDWKTYSEMTGYKISADKDYLDKFQETQTAVLTGFKSMEEQHQIFADSIAKATSSMIEAYRATQEMQQLAMQDGDTSMDNFASDAAKTIDKVGTQTEKLADEAVKLSEQFRDSFSDIADNAKNFADNYVKNIQPAIDASQKLLTTISDIISHQADLGGFAASTSGSSGGQNSGTVSSGTKNWDVTTSEASQINAKSDIGEYLPFIGAVLQYAGYDTDYNGWGTSKTREERLEQVFGKGAVDDINTWMSEHAGDDSKNYYVAIADKLDKYSYETLGRMLGAFDTGGYTGSWGSSGRLAMLHEKELVLNREDTSNILGAVDMVRNIAQVIDLNARATNQAMSTAFNAASVSSGNQVFEQQVTINADFPNATDRDEIIAAFDNLTNLAMQYAGRA